MPSDETTYKAPAIQRAAMILEYLAERADEPSLSDISRALGYGKSTTHGLLHTLESVGWVEREDGGYRVGKGLLGLARRSFGLRDATAAARPFMEKLAEELGESVCVGRPQGGRIVIDDCVEGGGGMRIALRPGLFLPLLAAATGKAFFSGFSPAEARARLGEIELPRFTERSITDRQTFLEEVERCRSKGYATDDEEYLRGVRAVAAPIRFGDRTAAVLWVVGLALSFTDDAMARAAEELTRAVGIISRLLVSADGGTDEWARTHRNWVPRRR